MGEPKQHSLEDVINAGIDNRLIDLHTCIPGEIVSYKASTQTAQVKISIDRIINGAQQSYPILDEIPVVFPRGSGGGINFPLSKGDGVMLLFCERNTDLWRSNGSGSPPYDRRKFDIGDAFVVPGLFPSNGVIKPTPFGGTELRGENVFVGDPTAIPVPPSTLTKRDLVEMISVLCDTLSNAQYGSSPGPIDPASKTIIDSVKQEVDKLKV